MAVLAQGAWVGDASIDSIKGAVFLIYYFIDKSTVRKILKFLVF
jgi:hypothetical protein